MGQSKGSKNKPKQGLKQAKILPKQAQDETLEATVGFTIDSLCKICDRVSFGKTTYLGFGHWRHDNCALGSEEYKLYFERQTKQVQAALRPFLNHFEEL